ncbi:DUF6491 family protein [Algibacillus agarilyticus]|uniref:DUF6491 family protein n=1 Tax=Algibacillus agarilyticus TaxID=2234133 RepID=UPI000DCF86F9|nr:DUF6491 family protein [Algibacillus agarilyticus]
MIKLIFFISLTINLISCAQLPTEKKIPSISDILAEKTQQDGRVCIDKSDIKGFGTGPFDTLFVDGNRDEYYIITTRLSCFSLDTAFQIGFESRSYQICGNRTDSIVTADYKCPIGKIFKLESRKKAHDLMDEAQAIRESMME